MSVPPFGFLTRPASPHHRVVVWEPGWSTREAPVWLADCHCGMRWQSANEEDAYEVSKEHQPPERPAWPDFYL